MRVARGTYTGNGTSQSFAITDGTGGFQPQFVLTKGGSNIACFTMSSMGADLSGNCTGSSAPAAGKITSLDATGFSVGSSANANANGTAYYYIAIGDNGVLDFNVGTYVGTGSAGTPVVTTGFQPDLIITQENNAQGPRYTSSARASANTAQAFNAAEAAGIGWSFDATGFTCQGTSALTNELGVTYYYMALKNSLVSKILQYTSDGADNRSITGVAFQPQWAMINSTGAAIAVIHDASNAADSSELVTAAAAAADRIQAFEATGVQIGADANVNPAAATAMMLWAMKAGATLSGGGSTGGKGKGGGKGGGTGTPKPPGKFKTFGTGHWRWGDGRRWG